MRRRLAIALALAGLCGLAPTGAGGTALAPLPRATADRPDDYAGLQIHVVYAAPSDLPDRAFDTDGSIEGSVQAFQGWLAGQTGGRALRLDTFQGSLDVTFHRLSRPDADYASRGLRSRDLLEEDLRAAGLVTSKKVYLVYFDSSNSAACGGAAWPPALPGTVAAQYLRGQLAGSPPCLSTGFAPPNGPPRYTEFAALHEVLHPMGLVGSCAPHHTLSGHVGETPNDLMYAGNQPWTPSVLDFGRDDYFGSGSTTCPDLTTVGFLRSDAEFTLTVTKMGDGSVVSERWPVVDCGATCSAPFPRGTVVTLRAVTPSPSSFRGWGGACSGRALTCTVAMDASKTVTARFSTVVSAPRRCRVPRVVGRTLRIARRVITRAGCRVGRIRRARSRVRVGRVVRQSPRARALVRRGTRVNLTVSRGRR